MLYYIQLGDQAIPPFPSSKEEFLHLIFNQDLMDIPLIGGNFMWSNNHDVQCWSNIDRLYSHDWEEQFPDIFQRRFPIILSNHFWLMLNCGISNRRSQHFKFENMWLKSEGFVDQVKRW
jgi:hypothetical protein